jgi:hypothetical protein
VPSLQVYLASWDLIDVDDDIVYVLGMDGVPEF